jgi:thioredoxin reductase (NADPH)
MQTTDVENYPGYPEGVMGPQMMEDFREQARRFGADCRYGMVTDIEFDERPYKLTVDEETEIFAKSIIISTGASAKWLGLDSEQRLRGKGVSACATCDGFFYKDQDVAVIGGGNTAMEEALYLSNIARHVTIVHRRDKFRGEKILQQQVFKKAEDGRIAIRWNAQLDEVLGDQTGVTGLRLKSTDDGTTDEIPVTGAFIAIGHKPNTDLFVNQLDMEGGYIQVRSGLNGNATATSVPGVFAAGDVMDHVYRQAVTSAGTGCMAALDAEKYLDALDVVQDENKAAEAVASG